MKNIFNKISSLLKDGEAVRYIIIGGCTTLLNFLVYSLFIYLFGLWGIEEKTAVTISNIISVVLSILFAYVMNKLVVFRSHCGNLLALTLEFIKFVGARGITMLIEIGGVYLLFNILGVHEMISKLITQVIVIIGNYFISKLLVFTKTERKDTKTK